MPEPSQAVPQAAAPVTAPGQSGLAASAGPVNPQAGQVNPQVGQSDAGSGPSMGSSCTAPQLRRFIKSRPYVPMHELRRRFAINGGDDDVTAVDLAGGRVFVGLPAREGDLLGELLRGGEVGFELSLDPRSPIVVGLYPMRPIPRP
jgi:hypothetical protein